MDFTALFRDPNWQAFLDSEEFKGRIAAQQNLLINAKLDAEERGFVRGQLRALVALEGWVRVLAQKQEADFDKVEQAGNGSRFSRLRKLTPRIF